MLFNSIEFLFFFLPFTLLAYHLLAKWRFHGTAMLFLTLASLFYYSWWDVRGLPLILASTLFNFAMGRLILVQRRRGRQKICLALGIAANLLLLGYYKYTAFFIASINAFMGTAFDVPHIVLPLAISFFTFTQIAYLADVYMEEKFFRERQYGLLPYSLFITVFPQLIAGPILYHGDLIPQFSHRDFFRFSHENMCTGLTFFVIGLAKKTLIADGLSEAVDLVFLGAQQATFFEAWLGAVAYTLQIYFDFSGYSEMAVGLCLMFNMRLPLNFDSPYQALSIVDFWRRWHKTLSSFLKKYLYIPLGGNRYGQWKKGRNLLLTMLLGGLWHGAGWTFVVWGGLHGVYLLVNHAWRAGTEKLKAVGFNLFLPKAVSWLATFLAVVVAWVFFRANDIGDAAALLKRMFDLKGVSLFSALSKLEYPLLDGIYRRPLFMLTALALFLALKCPNILHALGYRPESEKTDVPVERYPRVFIFLLALLFFFAAKRLFDAEPSEFLYFNF
jgi:alginate O-acetyltransferase complex protein AlgI